MYLNVYVIHIVESLCYNYVKIREEKSLNCYAVGSWFVITK